MKRALFMAVALATLASASLASADDPIPDVLRAKLEAMAPIRKPIIYVPAANGQPARWLVFIGPTSAFSAWVVTPGAGEHELVRVEEWPAGVRVIGAIMGTMAESVPQVAKGTHYEFVVVETMAAPELNQPAGLRSIIPVPIVEPKNTSYAAIHDENLPSYAGVKDERDAQARVDAVGRFWNEDTTDGLIADLQRSGGALDAARKSDAALAAMIPSDGIAVVATWRSAFGRETGRITALDASAGAAALRAAVLAAPPCAGHTCGPLLIGAEKGHLVIRALLQPNDVPPDTRHPRRLVAANPSDTQTGATARALGFPPVKILGEAPLHDGGGTVGLIDDGTSLLLIARDGDYAVAWQPNGDAREPPIFADFDGDGTTDVLLHSDGGPMFDLGASKRGNDLAPGLQMAVVGKRGLPAIATAALMLEEGPVKAADACALVSGARTPAELEKVLAPHAEIFSYDEPGQPALGQRAMLSGKTRVKELQSNLRKPCGFVCDPNFPICVDAWEPPGVNYYLFSNAKGKLRLWRAALYRGG